MHNQPVYQSQPDSQSDLPQHLISGFASQHLSIREISSQNRTVLLHRSQHESRVSKPLDIYL